MNKNGITVPPADKSRLYMQRLEEVANATEDWSDLEFVAPTVGGKDTPLKMCEYVLAVAGLAGGPVLVSLKEQWDGQGNAMVWINVYVSPWGDQGCISLGFRDLEWNAKLDFHNQRRSVEKVSLRSICATWNATEKVSLLFSTWHFNLTDEALDRLRAAKVEHEASEREQIPNLVDKLLNDGANRWEAAGRLLEIGWKPSTRDEFVAFVICTNKEFVYFVPEAGHWILSAPSGSIEDAIEWVDAEIKKPGRAKMCSRGRQEMIRALDLSGGRTARETIEGTLKDRDPDVRNAAARVFERNGWSPNSGRERILFLISKEKWSEIEQEGKEAIEPLLSEFDMKGMTGCDVDNIAKTIIQLGGDSRAVDLLLAAREYELAAQMLETVVDCVPDERLNEYAHHQGHTEKDYDTIAEQYARERDVHFSAKSLCHVAKSELAKRRKRASWWRKYFL